MVRYVSGYVEISQAPEEEDPISRTLPAQPKWVIVMNITRKMAVNLACLNMTVIIVVQLSLHHQ